MITSSNIVEFFELVSASVSGTGEPADKGTGGGGGRLRCMTIRLCAAWTATRQPDGFVQYEKKLKRKHLPIIALTANVFAEDSERALRAGMDAHMGKPVEVPQLLATMMH